MTGRVSTDERRFVVVVAAVNGRYAVTCGRCGAASDGPGTFDTARQWMEVHEATAVASGACR